jgi:hypothetical protein
MIWWVRRLRPTTNLRRRERMARMMPRLSIGMTCVFLAAMFISSCWCKPQSAEHNPPLQPAQSGMSAAASGKTRSSDNGSSDRISHMLREIAHDANAPSDVRNRAETALKRWESPARPANSGPFLVRAMLHSPYSAGRYAWLQPIAIDQNLPDLCGVRVKEERTDGDGTTSVTEEDYPVYVCYLAAPLEGNLSTPVHIRAGNERKDMRLWEEYLIDCIDRLIYENIARPGQRRVRSLPEPPVWISAPDAGELRVFVAVFDRTGNRSEYVELEDLRDPKYEKTVLKYQALDSIGFYGGATRGHPYREEMWVAPIHFTN